MDKIVVSWFGPWWGDSKYIDQGRFTRMTNGKTGEAVFGLPNRGVTLASRKFVESGTIDRATWGALESLYVGAEAIATMDLQHKNAPDGTTRLQIFGDYVEAHGELQYFLKSAQETGGGPRAFDNSDVFDDEDDLELQRAMEESLRLK